VGQESGQDLAKSSTHGSQVAQALAGLHSHRRLDWGRPTPTCILTTDRIHLLAFVWLSLSSGCEDCPKFLPRGLLYLDSWMLHQILNRVSSLLKRGLIKCNDRLSDVPSPFHTLWVKSRSQNLPNSKRGVYTKVSHQEAETTKVTLESVCHNFYNGVNHKSSPTTASQAMDFPVITILRFCKPIQLRGPKVHS
jgi:hypothetical protein